MDRGGKMPGKGKKQRNTPMEMKIPLEVDDLSKEGKNYQFTGEKKKSNE